MRCARCARRAAPTPCPARNVNRARLASTQILQARFGARPAPNASRGKSPSWSARPPRMASANRARPAAPTMRLANCAKPASEASITRTTQVCARSDVSGTQDTPRQMAQHLLFCCARHLPRGGLLTPLRPGDMQKLRNLREGVRANPGVRAHRRCQVHCLPGRRVQTGRREQGQMPSMRERQVPGPNGREGLQKMPDVPPRSGPGEAVRRTAG